jgi:hypothetical protein
MYWYGLWQRSLYEYASNALLSGCENKLAKKTMVTILFSIICCDI